MELSDLEKKLISIQKQTNNINERLEKIENAIFSFLKEL